MRWTAAMSMWCLGTLLAIGGCSNDFEPAELARASSLGALEAAGGIYELGDFALYVPAGPTAPRAVLVALGGPSTRAFVTGEPFGAPFPELEAALQGFGQSLREFADGHRIAILGTSRFGPNPLPNEIASDQLLMDVLRDGAEASGHASIASAPILLYGLSGGAPEASGFYERHTDRVIGLFLKVPEVTPTITTESQRRVPVFIALAEFDVFVDNAAAAQSFAASRAGGAPWALAMELGVPHHAVTPVHQQNTLAWMDAVLNRRLAGASGRITQIAEQSGWLGNPSTGEVSPWGAYSGDRSSANWLPTRAAAELWRVLAGF